MKNKKVFPEPIIPQLQSKYKLSHHPLRIMIMENMQFSNRINV